MKIEATEFLPLARREAIITKEVDGELLVYDVTRDKAHCLNETAAAVWRLCDGRTSVAAIGERLAVSRQTAVASRQTAVASRQTAGADGSGEKAEGSELTADGFSLSTQHSALSTSTQHSALSTSTQHSALSTSKSITPDTQIVWLALDQLRRSHLLEQSPDENDKTSWSAAFPGFANMTRREAVRRIGLGAAITLPIVISMTAPTAVEAAVSCGAKCHPCTSPVDCCGVCSNSNVPGCPATTPRCT
jgi:hypothetical protein